MSDRVSLKIESGVAHVALNRANKRNALDLDMFKAIHATQQQLQTIKGVRTVILTGAGEDFCSGLDVKSMMSNRRAMITLLWKWLPWQANLAQRMSVGWRRLPFPVIAVIQGRCWGGGLQIALGADFRLAHIQASLSIMESKWGLIPDMGGSIALREMTHLDQACRLTMTAETIDAVKAKQLGLLTEVCNDPLKEAMSLSDQLKQRSPDSLALIKRLYHKNWNSSEGKALGRETFYQWKNLAGKNQSIAVRRQKGEDIDYRY